MFTHFKSIFNVFTDLLLDLGWLLLQLELLEQALAELSLLTLPFRHLGCL
jgi:hypothetical protein